MKSGNGLRLLKAVNNTNPEKIRPDSQKVSQLLPVNPTPGQLCLQMRRFKVA
jgi:hypothetical protein